MFQYILQRLALSVLVIVGVSTIVFGVMGFLPGDIIMAMVGENSPAISPEAYANFRLQFGLDDPIYVRYLRFLDDALHGDLGRSMRSNKPVIREIAEQLPSTIQLAVAAMVVALALGLLLGIIAAVNQNSWLDTAAMLAALSAVSMPQFWLGLLLILVFSLHLGWFPITGMGGVKFLVLPAVALGTRSAAVLARLTRSSLLEVLSEDYVRTARAKGLAETVVIVRHALKNALIPVTTVAGLQFGSLLAGAFVIEVVFNRQGIGQVVVGAILNRDYPVVQGGVLVAAVGYVLVNLLVDVLYAYVNPRIRYG